MLYIASMLLADETPSLVISSQFHPVIAIYKSGYMVTLRFSTISRGIRQSVVDVRNPDAHPQLGYYKALMMAVLWFDDATMLRPRHRRGEGLRFLFIGLGGGYLPRWYHYHFPLADFDIVEID